MKTNHARATRYLRAHWWPAFALALGLALYAQAHAQQTANQAASGPAAAVMPVDTNRWAWIPPGTFTMGSPATEQDRESDEGPQTQVTITRGFWMGRYEVTQGEYQTVMGSNPSKFSGNTNRPVEQVSWFDATNYCAKLTERERTAGRLRAGYVYRLPTEAEWEYASLRNRPRTRSGAPARCEIVSGTHMSTSRDTARSSEPRTRWIMSERRRISCATPRLEA
jgi:formylglycine-generating enzyme required for sulfatase activity